jgi:chromosome segregation ATPase
MGNTPVSQKGTAKEWASSAGLLQRFAKELHSQVMEYQVDDAEDVVVSSKAEAKRLERLATELQAKITKKQAENERLGAELAASTKALDAMNKKLQKNLLQQEVAKQEIEIMGRAVEVVKSKANNF